MFDILYYDRKRKKDRLLQLFARFVLNQQRVLEDIRSETELSERSEFSVLCEYRKYECSDLTNRWCVVTAYLFF